MFKARLSHFLVISLALHSAALFLLQNDPPAKHWLAGPVIVRLAPLAESTPQSRPASRERTAPTALKPGKMAKTRAVTAAEKPLPQRRPARPIPARAAAANTLFDPDTSREPAQHQTVETTTRTAELEQRLTDRLRTALMPHFSYPLLARRRGWEGVVRVGMRIEANGSLTRLHLVEGSPYGVLNTAAINSLSRLGRLPNADTWLQGGHVDLVLPVEYRLLEG